MEILVGKTAGFCGGVLNSVNNAESVLNEKKSKVYCLGELVHNSVVVNSLSEKGLIIIDSLKGIDNCDVIVRAHGVSKSIYDESKIKNINLIDLTCPNVLKIHNLADNYAQDGYFIILVGQRNHPETIGTISFCGDNSFTIESLEDIEECVTRVNSSKLNKIVVLVQTTYSLLLFDEICSILKNRFVDKDLVINNTICMATSNRQKECDELSKNVDCMIIIGGRNSSNTKKLFEVANKNCKSYIVETSRELDEYIVDIKKCNKVGVMAGASTPSESIDDVVNLLGR